MSGYKLILINSFLQLVYADDPVPEPVFDCILQFGYTIADVMIMAWRGICAEHKTVDNLETRKAFTLAISGTDTLRE